MTLPNSAKAQDEPTGVVGYPGLVGVQDDTGIKQRRCFERIFVHEIGTDELPLNLSEAGMGLKRIFHFRSASLEGRQQISVATIEIIEHFSQNIGCNQRIERQDPVDDMIGPRLVRGIEVSRFGRGFERAHEDTRRVRA
jgi:hypothetical protein